MGRKIVLSILFLTLISIPCISSAQVYDVQATGEYVMGDSDTKIEARKIALELAKRSAVEQIGTYLESETVVKDHTLTKDEIRTYASAIVKTSVLSEGIKLLEDKTTVFNIRIKANVDIGMLGNKIKEIKADTERKEQINALQTENLKLLKELESLSLQLKNEKIPEYKALRQKREIIFENLEKNQNSLRVAFERGTLLNLAIESKNQLEEDKKSIEDTFHFLAQNIRLSVGKVQVRHKGYTSDLLVPVRWEMDNTKFNEFLKMMDRFSNGSLITKTLVSKRSILFSGVAFKGVDREELYRYFCTKKLVIYIETGNWKTSEIIGGLSGYYTFNLEDGQDLTIKDIPIDRLKEITNINAKIVVE